MKFWCKSYQKIGKFKNSREGHSLAVLGYFRLILEKTRPSRNFMVIQHHIISIDIKSDLNLKFHKNILFILEISFLV